MHARRSIAPFASHASTAPGEREPRRTLLACGVALCAGTGIAFALLARLATADAVTAPRLPDPAPAVAERADCLWYAARNHGFFPIQRAVVRSFARAGATRADAASEADLRFWERFAATLGAQECGVSPGDSSSLLAALAATADDADRYFLGDSR